MTEEKSKVNQTNLSADQNMNNGIKYIEVDSQEKWERKIAAASQKSIKCHYATMSTVYRLTNNKETSTRCC